MPANGIWNLIRRLNSRTIVNGIAIVYVTDPQYSLRISSYLVP